MWGYLAEFWDLLVQVGEYPIEFFQGIGNAVAGAIGGFFADLIHHIYDVFYIIWWVFDNLQNLFSVTVFKPLVWIFNFCQGFLHTALSTPAQLGLQLGEVAQMPDNVFLFINAIPYGNYIFTCVGAVVGLTFLVVIIKKLSSI